MVNVSDGVIALLGVKSVQLFDRNFSEISRGVMRRFEKIASKDLLRILFGCGTVRGFRVVNGCGRAIAVSMHVPFSLHNL